MTFYLRLGRNIRSLYKPKKAGVIPPPPTPNVFWFDAETNQYFIPPNRQNGDGVTQWQNRINTGSHLSDLGGINFRPTYLTNQQNGLSALSFNIDRLRGTPYPAPLTQSFSLFVVAKFNTIANQQLCETATGPVTQLGFGLSGNRYNYAAAGGNSIGSLADTNWHVHSMIVDIALVPSQRIQARVDSVPSVLAPISAPGALNIATSSFFYVGQRSDSTLPFAGSIGEIQMYNTALTSQEISLVEQDLMTKWGI